MLESVIFHTQLSSIMEALATTAVAEITKLVDNYSAFLRLELSRKTLDNEILKNKLKVGDNGNCVTLEQEDTGGAVLRERLWNDGGGQADVEQDVVITQQGGSEWDDDGPLAAMRLGDEATLTDGRGEPVTVKQERLDEDDLGAYPTPQTELRMTPEQSSTPLVTPQQHPAEQPGLNENWGFQSLPAGGTHGLTESMEHHIDHMQSVEHHSRAHCVSRPAGVELIRKREPQSPDLNPLGGEPGQEVSQGTLSHVYPEYAALTLGNNYTNIPESYLPFSSEHASTTMHDPASLPGRYAGGVNSHHRDQRVGGAGRPTLDAKEEKFVCKHCGKGFPYMSSLRRHTPNHTGERPYHCTVCGRSFIRQSHLRRHELLHTGVRPFACELCSRRFSRVAHLRAHMKVHA